MPVIGAEQAIRTLGAFAGLGTLATAIVSMVRSLHRPVGREEPGARFALRRSVLLLVTFLFIAVGVLLWRPLPVQLSRSLRAFALLFGSFLFFGGLALYLWGLQSLGQMFGPSSGFGVRLQAAHQLIVTGPYAHIRHPMYLGVIVAAMGSLLVYRTWAALGFATIMFGLVVRARREEKILHQEFGSDWEEYASRVRAWLPRVGRRRSGA